MQVMMRHRTSRQLDAAKAWNIENAYLACNPRTQASAPVKRTPVQRYIHKLLFSCVQQQDVKIDKLVRHLRRLPWGQCEAQVLKTTCEVCACPHYAVLLVHLSVCSTSCMRLPGTAEPDSQCTSQATLYCCVKHED